MGFGGLLLVPMARGADLTFQGASFDGHALDGDCRLNFANDHSAQIGFRDSLLIRSLKVSLFLITFMRFPCTRTSGIRVREL